MHSSIQVLKHYFISFSLISHDEPDGDAMYSSKIGINADKLETEEEGEFWQISLLYEFGSDNERQTEYSGKLELEGIFRIQPDFPEKKRESLARMNGGAVLLAAAREAVLNQTLRSRYGALELPLVDARTFLPEELQQQPLIPPLQTTRT